MVIGSISLKFPRFAVPVASSASLHFPGGLTFEVLFVHNSNINNNVLCIGLRGTVP